VFLALLGLALLAPALGVLWAVWRQRGWIALGGDAWFQGWQGLRPQPAMPAPPEATDAMPSIRTVAIARRLAPIVGVLALIGVVMTPRPRHIGPEFVVQATRAWSVADSMLRARGQDPAHWRRLSSTARDTLGELRRFLRQHDAESLAVVRSGDYAIPAWWIIRYVRPEAPVEQRAEEWRVRVRPDGRPLDVRHLIPEEASRDSISPDSARRLAMIALDSEAIDTAALRELEFVETPRPARRDATVTYVDTSVVLPDAATARVSVGFAGTEVVAIRREIRLPEAFVRESRSEGQKAIALSGLLAMPAIGLLIAGMVRSRRRPIRALDDIALALTMLAERRAARVAGVVAFLVLAGGAFLTMRLTGESNVSVIDIALSLVRGALIVLAIATVGRVSVLSWFLGALFFTMLGIVPTILHAPTGIERLGGLLATLVAAILIVGGEAIARRAATTAVPA
jgi:hypothetical protein